MSSAVDAPHGLIMGPPGSGKGTMAKRITRDFGFEVLSTGDLIRAQISSGTDVGKEFERIVAEGKLVPAEVVMKLVKAEIDLREGQRWMLDGFPRSLEQAELVDAAFSIDFVINVDVPFDTIVQRLSSRWCHLPSGRIYNLDYNPPKVAGLDDETGEPLIQREDDKPETVVARLDLYNAETKPLIDHYTAKGVLKNFTGTESDVIYPMIHAHMKDELKL